MEAPINDSEDFIDPRRVQEDAGSSSLPEYMYYQPPPVQQNDKKRDIFGEMDRTMYIILFVVFILGFFMGKTMQPVILRQ